MLTSIDHKSGPGVDLTNILRARFLNESKLSSFPLSTFLLCNFGDKILYEQRASKMLMQLTAGVDLTNILREAFTQADPKSTKILQSSCQPLLGFWYLCALELLQRCW